MPKRIKPQGDELKELITRYHHCTHQQKLALADEYAVSYATMKNWINQEYRPLPPHFKWSKTATWEEHIEIFKLMDMLTADHQYIPPEISFDIPTELPIGITFTADWQLGLFGVDYDSFARDMKSIESELGLYCYPGGDGYQNTIQPEKSGSSHNQIPIAPQKGLYVQVLQFLRKKIIAVGTGNHNYWAQLATGEDWDFELARRLNVLYTKHGGMIDLRVGEMVYPIFRLHKGRFESSFNPTHSCKQYQRLHAPRARIVVVEHRHIAAMEQARYNDCECVYIRPGTYAVYDDFAQQHGYYGQHVANPTVILYPYEDKLIGFKDMHDSIVYLREARNGN